MGQLISSVIDSVDGSDQKQQQQLQTLEMLQTMADTRFKLWKATINAPTGSAKLMEVDYILQTQHEIYAQVSSGDGVGDTIKDIVSGFTQGPLVQGVTNAITKIFSKLIQTTKSGMTQKTATLTILGSMGSVIRLDYFGYAYSFVNYGLENKKSQVVLWSYMISSINVEKILNVNAFKSLIDLQYKDLNLGEKQKLLKLIYEGLDLSIQNNHSMMKAFSLNSIPEHRPLQIQGNLTIEQLQDFTQVNQLTGIFTFLTKQAFKAGMAYVGYMYDVKLKAYLTVQRTSKNFVFATAFQYSKATKFTMSASSSGDLFLYSEIGGKKYYLLAEQDGKVAMQGDQPKDKLALNWNAQSNEMFQVYSKNLGANMGIKDQQEIDKQVYFKSGSFDIQFGFAQINKDLLTSNQQQIFQNYERLYPTVWKHKLRLQ